MSSSDSSAAFMLFSLAKRARYKGFYLECTTLQSLEIVRKVGILYSNP